MLNVPPAQAAHVRSVVLVPAAVTYCPASQFVHATQLAALVDVLNVSAPQAEQLRSFVLVPAVLTYCPALQSLKAEQLAAFVVVL